MDSANNKSGSYRDIIPVIWGAMFGVALILIVFLSVKIIEGFVTTDLFVGISRQIQGLPSSWVGGFLSGVVATLVGFVLTMSWDLLKSYRDRLRRDNTLLTSAKHELLTAIDSLNYNKNIIEDELESLEKKKFIIVPLAPVYGDVWGLFKLHIPKKVVKNPDLLIKIRDVSYGVEHLNEISASRENYRLSNMNMTNHNDILKIYDNIVLNGIKNLLPEVEALVGRL